MFVYVCKRKYLLGKHIVLEEGTRIIDLSILNADEAEVLIFPSEGKNLLIEPVTLLHNKTKRNTYLIRNANNAAAGVGGAGSANNAGGGAGHVTRSNRKRRRKTQRNNYPK
jgi:hypothetical protein